MHRIVLPVAVIVSGFCVVACEGAAPSTAPAGQAPFAAATGPAVNLVFEDFPVRFADYFCIQGLGAVKVADPRPPVAKSARPLLVHQPQGTLPAAMLFDQSDPSKADNPYDVLYVDRNGNGDFADDPVYRASESPVNQGPDGAEVYQYFRDVRMPRAGTQGETAHVQVFLNYADWAEDGPPFSVTTIAQRWAVGRVKIGERTVPVALIDRTWNDRFTDAGGLDPKWLGDGIARSDYLVLGVGEEDDPLRPAEGLQSFGRGGSPGVFLTPRVQIDGELYDVKAKQSAQGVRLEFQPAKAAMGQLRLGHGGGEYTLVQGMKTAVLLPGYIPGDEVTVPADTYAVLLGQSAAGPFPVEADQATQYPRFVMPLKEDRPRVVRVGQVAPPLETRTVDGKPLKLADHRGKVVLLDFWATWCAPCIAEMPRLRAVHERFGKDPRFVLIGVSVDEEADALKAFLAKSPLPWAQAYPDEEQREEILNAYGVQGIPASFLISPEGRILAVNLRGEAIGAAVAEALAAPAATQAAPATRPAAP